MGQTSLDGWRGIFINGLVGYDPTSVWDCLVHGLAYFLPLYIVVFVAGILAELWFASKRGHEINEGYFVTSILFTSNLAAVDSAVDGRRGCCIRRGCS